MLLPKELSYDELLDSETHVTDKRVYKTFVSQAWVRLKFPILLRIGYFRSSHGVGVTPGQDRI